MKATRHLYCALMLISGIVAPPGAFAQLDLNAMPDANWTRAHAAHLSSRAGFGATPTELNGLERLTPSQAVSRYVSGLSSSRPLDFVHSNIFDEGLDPFPPSRPATTTLAKETGHALGVDIKPAGNRPLQPVVNKFFYWLRASRLETDRVAYWWANRMLTTDHPLQEKLALFWHGHFATNEDKVRDYRKMLQQLQLFQDKGMGNFRELLISVAQDPAMLVFLDAGVNTKDSPNENFAREIMELFTMGVGHYSEADVREAARAFTGWNQRELAFHVDPLLHDDGEKTILGQTGGYDGVEVIDLILAQQVTAQFIGTKLYRYFVNEAIGEEDRRQLGELMVSVDYDVSAFLEILFLSNEFYATKNLGSRIKPPVEMVVATYRQLGLEQVPGVPDFNTVTGQLGQRLMHPPTVAGWAQGNSWVTPGLLFERANFVLDALFPDIGFVAPDRYPTYTPEIVNVQNRLRQGMSVSAATRPTGVESDSNDMAASNLLADRDEDFNTRIGSMRGWQMALERVRPISRHVGAVGLSAMVRDAQCETSQDVIDLFLSRFFLVTPDAATKQEIVQELTTQLGTNQISQAESYMEQSLRQILHRLLSLPEYQLG